MKNRLHINFTLLFAGAICLGALLVYARTTPKQPNPPALVWPQPPADPRIEFIQNILSPADVGIRPSTFGRMGNWITGARKGNESLDKPLGLSADAAGNLCITDSGAAAACFFDRAHNKWERWDKIGPNKLLCPVAMVHDSGTFFIADAGLGNILACRGKKDLLFTITKPVGRAAALAIRDQKLLVADAERHCVEVFDLKGKFLFEFGHRGVGAGEFNFPTHIVAAGNEILVTDSLNSRVQVFDAQGKYLRMIGSAGDTSGHFSRPKGVAVDTFGHIYVVDAMFDNMQIFDREGRLLLELGGSGSAAGEFWLPAGIAITPRNEIFVADSHNHRVQMFRYTGQQ